jgi:uncharacterized protein
VFHPWLIIPLHPFPISFLMQISVAHDFLPKRNSTRASMVMDLFGIGFERGRHIIAEDLSLPIDDESDDGQIVLFTGESGSGKSSLMRGTADALSQNGRSVANVDALELGNQTLIDTLPLGLNESMQLLSACGLAEAHLMLRTPEELSDGQRYRFRLALALAQGADWILADEFTATLDRRLAKVVAFNIRKLADRTCTRFLLATTHEDVTEDLAPDLHVRCRLDGEIVVETDSSLRTSDELRNDQSDKDESERGRKKKEPARSPAASGSPRRPSPTGRTSLGGITAVTP